MSRAGCDIMKDIAKYCFEKETTEERAVCVGEEHGLHGDKLKDFVKYVRERFENHLKSSYGMRYIDTWASRFEDDIEFMFSDLEGRRLLKKLNRKKYSDSRKYK